jgi:hypothetical protein
MLGLGLTLGLSLGLSSALGAESLGALHTATLLQAREALGLDAFVSGSGRCPEDVARCFGIVVHVVVEGGAPVQTPSHFAAHVADANRLFAPIGIGFEVVGVEAEAGARAEIVTRSDRDRLGADGFSRGVVHVYLVRELADVDVEGEVIRGVHWRYRPEPARRWIILSALASSLVLSHELGHFFGLPHSGFPNSIMNKKSALPWSTRDFAEPELRRMQRHRDTMLRDGMLVDRLRRSAEARHRDP